VEVATLAVDQAVSGARTRNAIPGLTMPFDHPARSEVADEARAHAVALCEPVVSLAAKSLLDDGEHGLRRHWHPSTARTKRPNQAAEKKTTRAKVEGFITPPLSSR